MNLSKAARAKRCIVDHYPFAVIADQEVNGTGFSNLSKEPVSKSASLDAARFNPGVLLNSKASFTRGNRLTFIFLSRHSRMSGDKNALVTRVFQSRLIPQKSVTWCGTPRTDPISVGPVNVASWSARQSARDDLRSEKGKGERMNEGGGKPLRRAYI